MARWRAPARSGPWTGAPSARTLGDDELPAAVALCAVDPVRSALVAARLVDAQVSGLRRAPGVLWGFPATGPVEALCWAGANLVPFVPDGVDRDEAVEAFAAQALRLGRRSSSVVGERPEVLALWALLATRWPAAREVRDDQPSLAIALGPDVDPDPGVRRSRPEELGAVLPACVKMFVEEVGYSPVASGGSAYEMRVRQLIRDGRSFVRRETELAGEPISFKAELGAVTPSVAQVQGVWVDPAFRGRGLSEHGMAAVVRTTLAEVAPVVSLYVNAYNERALRAYRRVGFEQVGTYATVLF